MCRRTTSQSAAMFYDRLFSSLDFTLPRAATGRRGFPKEAMVCAFIVMKCEGFTRITDLMDYLDNNSIIAHYCGFNIMEPLPSYWTYDRCLRQGVALNTGSSPRITGFPLTAVASVSRGHTPCVQSVKDTTPALRRLDRNGCGCATAPARQTSTHWPTSPL